MPKSHLRRSRKNTQVRQLKSGAKPRTKPRVKLRTKSEAKPEVQTSVKVLNVLKGVTELWKGLFSSPVHLDSILSKQSASIKSILAQLLPLMLLRPVSQAESLGIGIAPGEPWNLTGNELVRWRPVQLLAERLYLGMTQGVPTVPPMLEDFPPHMIQDWKENWGEDATKELVNILGREAPLSLRASRRVGSQALLEGLKQEVKLPVRVTLSNLSPLAVRLAGYAPVLNTELYQKGAFEIQDEGSQLMALFALWPERYAAVLKAVPGEVKNLELLAPPPPKEIPVLTVVDACAGAGGKSLAIADALKGKGRVYAYDVSEKKLQALRRRATRAGLNNIQAVAVKEGKEEEVTQRFKGQAQVVLVDAPCSGWGVLRRNPDIKWRQAPEVLNRFPELQFRLLNEYANLVVSGGRLVYGVCTFRKQETTSVIERFLDKNPQFILQEGGYLGPGPCDGFFMQALVKKA